MLKNHLILFSKSIVRIKLSSSQIPSNKDGLTDPNYKIIELPKSHRKILNLISKLVLLKTRSTTGPQKLSCSLLLP